VVFIQVAMLGAGAEEDELLSDINEIVTRTNSTYGNIIYQPMVFRYQDFEFLDYLGMLCAADALVITSLREGWNLTSHEYVVCQEKTKHGFILSEVPNFRVYSYSSLVVLLPLQMLRFSSIHGTSKEWLIKFINSSR
jgi:trehalose-6-phosphate synthase